MSDAATTARHRGPAPVGSAVVVAALVAVNLAQHLLHWDMLWLGPLGAVALLAFARWRGLTWTELGLARHQWLPGLRWGAGVVVVVALVYLGAVLIPTTRPAFLDTRYHLAPAEALLSALVLIPVSTVLFEEVAFRSVLWGFLSRHLKLWQVAVVSSVLFGLWHVLPAIASAGADEAVATAADRLGSFAQLAVIAGTVLVTTAGGLVAAWLRWRSGSLLASVGMHWATNGLGVLFGLLAWQLAS